MMMMMTRLSEATPAQQTLSHFRCPWTLGLTSVEAPLSPASGSCQQLTATSSKWEKQSSVTYFFLPVHFQQDFRAVRSKYVSEAVQGMGISFRKLGWSIVRGFPLLQTFLQMQGTFWNDSVTIEQWVTGCDFLWIPLILLKLRHWRRGKGTSSAWQFVFPWKACIKHCYVFNLSQLNKINLQKFTIWTVNG